MIKNKKLYMFFLALSVIAAQTLAAVFMPVTAYASELDESFIDYENDNVIVSNIGNGDDNDFVYDEYKNDDIIDSQDNKGDFYDYGATAQTTELRLDAEIEASVKIGFIGWYPAVNQDGTPKVNQTSFYWQELKQGEMIDWDAVDAAYDDWVSKGGYPRATDGWHSSGINRIEVTEDQRHTIGFSDFSNDTLETLYQAYYLDSGYIASHIGGAENNESKGGNDSPSGNGASPYIPRPGGSGSSPHSSSTTNPIPIVTILDDLVPLAYMPDNQDYFIIIDDEIPLGKLPHTGGITSPMGAIGNLIGLAGALSMGIIGMKKKDK